MKHKFFKKLSSVLLVVTGYSAFPQNPVLIANVQRNEVYNQDSVYVIADITYKNKSTKRWLLGDHYRQDWITPVKVPVLQLSQLHGGLIAKKEGGGLQTKSLRLQSVLDKDRQYVIRSIEKYPDRAIPQEFAGTFVSEFVKDQISSANPFAPLVVAHLAESAGIYHTNPKVVFVPHSAALGSFDSTFGNRFYLFEERPNDNWQDAAFFGNSKHIISTEDLQKLAMTSAAYRVDQQAYLRARLLDIFIGDWDRHEDQWAWAQFKKENGAIFRPIPRDRDQAFAKLDGVIPWLGTRKWAVRRTQHFGERIQDLKGLLWSGRNLDRALLTDLEWSGWQKEITHVQQLWTNTAIEQAVAQLPDTIYKLSGEQIKNKLISRRNDLQKYGLQFYKILAEDVEWVGSEEQDLFVIQRLQGCSTRVQQFAITSGGNKLIRERLFTGETKEIRIYGRGGNDIFQMDSSSNCNIKIRLIGEGGQDSYTGAGRNNYKKVIIYDDKLTKAELAHPGARIKSRFDSLTHVYQYKKHQYSTLMPVILPGYNPDDGLFLGGGILLKTQKWGYAPFAQQHFIAANYAFKTSAYNFWYDGIFAKALLGWDVHVAGKLNQPDYVLNFYGLGNNTELLTKNRAFNRVRVRQAAVAAGIQRTFNKKHELNFHGEFLTTRVESVDKRFVSMQNGGLDSLDFKRTRWAGGAAGYTFNKIDNERFPSKGITWKLQTRYLYSSQRKDHLWNNESSISAFVPVGKLVFAVRAGGAIVSGSPQFFQYNQLGGTANLRGYWRNRFSGKSSFYNNNELRIPLANVNGYLLRGKFGLTLFCDNGRVWVPDEDSGRWHVGYGVGAWIIPFGRIAFTAHYGFSEEDNVLTVRTGFLF